MYISHKMAVNYHKVYLHLFLFLASIISYYFHFQHLVFRTHFKGTNGRQKTYEIFHVYCIFYSGFMCQTTVIFGITKDGSLVLNTLAS